MSWRDDIRVVVGIDFGTTYSGFAYCHLEDVNEEIYINELWPGITGPFKTNTVLQYDDDFENVVLWGNPALCKKPKTVSNNWSGIDFMTNVLLVLTVPAEYSEKDKAIMRECLFEAGLIEKRSSEKLQLTTEPEAAAIFCMDSCLKEHKLTAPGTIFMIVDCGGGTVDLTTRKLLGENQLGEVTERAGDFCGSTFVEKEFIKLLEKEVGSLAVELFKKQHYCQMQYMLQDFCRKAKIQFSDDDPNFTYELDLDSVAPSLKQYITGEEEEIMKERDWEIEIDFIAIKSMFDPIVNRIIDLIGTQLKNSSGKCSAIFLVGGFSQSKYLQKAIKNKFSQEVGIISVPTHPIAAVVHGAALYGKSLKDEENLEDLSSSKRIIMTRKLTHTFGVLISPEWEIEDPPERITPCGRIEKFLLLAKRGTDATINQEFTDTLYPVYAEQTKLKFKVYHTKNQDAVYCDEPGMKLLGTLLIDLPDAHLGTKRPVTFSLSFGGIEIRAKAYNKTN
ncbi:11014_t:CDS:2, partial [Funneliformis geosporum]